MNNKQERKPLTGIPISGGTVLMESSIEIEKLSNLLHGEDLIDKMFAAKFRGKIYKAEEIGDGLEHPKFERNYLYPSLLKNLAIEGLTEIQILKGVCVDLQKIIDSVQDALTAYKLRETTIKRYETLKKNTDK